MAARLGRHVAVQTCIACGARTRLGDCESGCSEVALDLIEAAELAPLQERLDALERRNAALRSVLDAFARDPEGAWDSAREAGRDALRLHVPDPPRAPVVVAAWGCPDCGRVDAPQPCLDVCIRRPVEMADAAEYEELVARVSAAEEAERQLADVVGLIVHVRPRAGERAATRAWLVSRLEHA